MVDIEPGDRSLDSRTDDHDTRSFLPLECIVRSMCYLRQHGKQNCRNPDTTCNNIYLKPPPTQVPRCGAARFHLPKREPGFCISVFFVFLFVIFISCSFSFFCFSLYTSLSLSLWPRLALCLSLSTHCLSISVSGSGSASLSLCLPLSKGARLLINLPLNNKPPLIKTPPLGGFLFLLSI